MLEQLVDLGLSLIARRGAPAPCGPQNVFADNDVLNEPEYRPHLFHRGRSRPVMLICETTNICNNDCVVCPYGVMERKKSIMPMALFEKVLGDYCELGGGALSLTPMVGDVFLDKFLPERVRLVNRFEGIDRLSVTTNATFADRFSDAELTEIVASLDRLHISIYGLDAEEHAAFTRRNDHARVIASVRRLLGLCGEKSPVAFSFRVFKEYQPDDYRRWMREHFGQEVVFGATRTYANWGGTFDSNRPLPYGARWAPDRTNSKQCLLPLVACQVFVNGDVSFCPCCDYDAEPDFALGNVGERSLADIYNSPRVRQLWNWRDSVNMPRYCRTCTFHRPLDDLPNHKSLFTDPIGFIGG